MIPTRLPSESASPPPPFTGLSMCVRLAILATIATLVVSTAACARGEHGDREAPSRLVSAGEHVAQRNCAECHALGDVDVSPLPEAPPFSVLRTAYSRAVMEEVISERMKIIHPRMPKLELDVDEVSAFLDYWEKLNPRPGPAAPAR